MKMETETVTKPAIVVGPGRADGVSAGGMV